MNLFDLLKIKSNELAKSSIDALLAEHPGKDLKRMLGLEKFQYAYIQKVINYSKPVFVVTVDSRHSGLRISPTLLNRADFAFPIIVNIRYRQFVPKFITLTPPILLDDFVGKIGADTMIFFRDLAGEYHLDERMYESYQKKGLIIKNIKQKGGK